MRVKERNIMADQNLPQNIANINEKRTDRPSPKLGIMDIAPYVGGKSTLSGKKNPIKLSSNENPLGPSPLAIEAYKEAASILHRYPDGQASALRAEIASRFGLEPNRLIFGNGSDEVFSLVCQTFLQPGDSVVVGQYGFLAYKINALAAQATLIEVAEPDYCLTVEAILAAVVDTTRVIFISNPANPTGSLMSAQDIIDLADRIALDIVIVIDEAYGEFIDDPSWQSAFFTARGRPNMVVTRTFSKIHGLGGLRLGYGYGPEPLISAMERVRAPFNINQAALSAGLCAIKDEAHQSISKHHVLGWRPRLYQSLRGLGLKVLPSQGNFVLIDFLSEEKALGCNDHLMKNGIIVRHVANYQLPSCLRVTIGTDEENDQFFEAIKAFMSL